MNNPDVLSAIDLSRLDTYDFASVFGEEDNSGRTQFVGFARADVARLVLCIDGERDGDEWVAAGRLKDGRWFLARGGCDNTGWDCQSHNIGETFASFEDFVRGVGDEVRFNLGIASTIDGIA